MIDVLEGWDGDFRGLNYAIGVMCAAVRMVQIGWVNEGDLAHAFRGVFGNAVVMGRYQEAIKSVPACAYRYNVEIRRPSSCMPYLCISFPNADNRMTQFLVNP
jgi:hypothetical protein